MTNKIRVSDPQELLALIPYQLGFQPENSLVVMSLRGDSHRVGLIARCELDELTSETGQDLAHFLIEQCLKDGARRVFLAFYFDHQEPLSADTCLSEEQTVTILQAFMAYRVLMKQVTGQIEPDSIWVVGPHTYFNWAAYDSPGCDEHCGRQCDERCDLECAFGCPLHSPDGAIKLRSVSEFEATQVSASMVLNGLTYRKRREDLGMVARAPKAERDKAGASYRRHQRRLQQAQEQGGIAAWERQTLDLWQEILNDLGYQDHMASGCDGGLCRREAWSATGPSITPAQIGRIASGMSSRRVRDAILLSMTPDGMTTARQFLASELDTCCCGPNNTAICTSCEHPKADSHGESLVNDALAKIVSPARGVPPTTCLTEIAQEVLETVIAHTTQTLTAPQHALLCLLAWWKGNGAVARRHNELALKFDEDYRLANLFATVLDAGLAPGWARRQKT